MKCKDPNWTEKVPLLLLPQANQIRSSLNLSLDRSCNQDLEAHVQGADQGKNEILNQCDLPDRCDLGNLEIRCRSTTNSVVDVVHTRPAPVARRSCMGKSSSE